MSDALTDQSVEPAMLELSTDDKQQDIEFRSSERERASHGVAAKWRDIVAVRAAFT
jgi:hypothetical protein